MINQRNRTVAVDVPAAKRGSLTPSMIDLIVYDNPRSPGVATTSGLFSGIRDFP